MARLFSKMKEIGIFALPVVGGEISQIMFGIGDVLVAGRYSTEVLGAMGIANAFLFPYMVLGIGLLSVISPIKAGRLSAGESVEQLPGTAITLGLLAGLILNVLILLTCYGVVPLLNYGEQVEHLVQQYMVICAFSFTPALLFAVFKELLLARGYTFVSNGLILLFNFINVAANIYFMFTLELGIVGAALATFLSRLGMALVLFIYSHRKIQWQWRFCRETFQLFFKKGLPAGGSILVVAFIFAVVAMLVGRMGEVPAAANNILINITSFTYMIPLALSNVTAVKVAGALGTKSVSEAIISVKAALTLTLSTALIAAVLFFTIPFWVLRFFTDQPEVIEYGLGVLFFVAIYQLPDAVQAIFCGALRGMGITTFPLGAGFVGVWLIGLPIGCYLAYSQNMGAAGLWAGLAAGLSVMGVLLTASFIKHIKKLATQLSNG